MVHLAKECCIIGWRMCAGINHQAGSFTHPCVLPVVLQSHGAILRRMKAGLTTWHGLHPTWS